MHEENDGRKEQFLMSDIKQNFSILAKTETAKKCNLYPTFQLKLIL
jgi:hypothetical protein